MNNFEKIKSMTLDEMAYLLSNTNHYCNYCIYKATYCKHGCEYGIKQWLQAESEVNE